MAFGKTSNKGFKKGTYNAVNMDFKSSTLWRNFSKVKAHKPASVNRVNTKKRIITRGHGRA